MGSEGEVRHWGPLPAGPLRPSGPCCLGVAEAPFLTLGGWKTASFLGGLGSKWGPLLAGPLHVSGRCCLVFLSVQAAAVWFSCRFRPLLFGLLVGSESNEGFRGFGAQKTASYTSMASQQGFGL